MNVVIFLQSCPLLPNPLVSVSLGEDIIMDIIITSDLANLYRLSIHNYTQKNQWNSSFPDCDQESWPQ